MREVKRRSIFKMLQASEISVSYSGHQVVRGFSISMKTGRLVALLGPNGAGKTSALKALNGSLAAGEIGRAHV